MKKQIRDQGSEARGQDSLLTPHSALRTPRSKAFTLMELTVSVAILAGVMAMVGMIFQTAGKATSQAQSSSSVYRQLLFAAEAIRLDLDKINNVKVLGIAGVSVLAYENEKDRNSGRALNNNVNSPASDWHRTDVLMMFTDRQFDPYIFQQPTPAIKFPAVKQVVYGHADLGTLDASGNWVAASTKRIESATVTNQSDMTAFEWHLARRVIGSPPAVQIGPGTAPWPLTDPNFLLGTADVLQDPGTFILTKGFFKYKTIGPSYFFTDLGAGNFIYLFENNQWFHFSDTGDKYWYRYDSSQAAGSRWVRTQDTGTGPVTVIANPYPLEPPPLVLTNVNGADLTVLQKDWFYDPANPDRRTRLANNPQAGDNERLANYFLPSCSEFKVEFTYDDPHEVELTPDQPNAGDRTAEWEDWNKNLTYDPGEPLAAKPIRWQSVPPGEQWVWSGLSVHPNSYAVTDGRNYTDPHRWPRALRITLRAYGGSDRLERPITYTLMHAFK